MSEADPLIGALIADRYRVVQKLGEGGMGVVYKAVHEALRKTVALKLLAPAGRVDREAVARFEREAVAAANLRHPNIAEATDFGKLPDGALYLVMEYVEGTTLRHLLHDAGKLPPERALAILLQVGSALATAHARDVVHRDLKPENVIITSAPASLSATASGSFNAGGADFVKVIDFGIAKIRNATFGIGGGATAALTRAGMVFGTPEYMAPEQVMGQAVDARADQYALGVLAFELLTGKPPFFAEDTGQLMMMHVGAPVPSTRDSAPTLPPAADAVVTRMLAKLPDERFASVGDAMASLAAAIGLAPPTSVASASFPGPSLPGAAAINAAATRAERPPPAAPSTPGAPPTSGASTVRLDITAGHGLLPQSASQSASQAVPPHTLRSVAVDRSAQPPPQSAPGQTASLTPQPPPGAGPRSGPSPMPLPPVPASTGVMPVSNTVSQQRPRVTPPARLPTWIYAVGGATLLVGALVLVAVFRAFSGGPELPAEVVAALADWKGGKVAPAAAVLKQALTSEPELANDAVLARSLAESLQNDDARRALASLLETTPLGRSAPMATALADQAMKDDAEIRDPALELLRDRQDLLDKEQAARVRLRDSDDCDDLESARAELTDAATQPTLRDLERLPRDDCKRMLRKRDLCEKCRGAPGKGPGLGNMGKGKGKKDKKKGD